MKKMGFIRVNPSDYVIRFRKGKVYKEGIGMSFYKLPREQFVIIPSNVQRIKYVTDQITLENQGVEVSGFAIWKVSAPSKTYLHFNFDNHEEAISSINEFLEDVVNSAIRHKVSNMTIEEVLRKRGSIILELKKELEYMADLWGLNIETIEIREVKILSEKLFHNMQAKYRNQIRLESEKSTLLVEEEILKEKQQQEERIKLSEQEQKKRDLARKTEYDLLLIKNKEQIEKSNIEHDIKLKELQEEKKQKIAAFEIQTKKEEALLAEEEMKNETARKNHEAELMKKDIAVKKEMLTVSNIEDDKLVLIRNLPDIIDKIHINELNFDSNRILELIEKAVNGIAGKRG